MMSRRGEKENFLVWKIDTILILVYWIKGLGILPLAKKNIEKSLKLL